MKLSGVGRDGSLKVLSWNLLYRNGAAACDVARLIEQHRPDLVLLQEVTGGTDALAEYVGGYFHKLPWEGKSYALAAWSPYKRLVTETLQLPFSNVPGKFPPRAAQVLPMEGFCIVNAHLSHGQLLNRRQLRRIGASIAGPLAIIGDFNAIGPIVLRGFRDVGPRKITHMARRVVPFRLDRCLIRGMVCTGAVVLSRGKSDHRPILLELDVKRAPMNVSPNNDQMHGRKRAAINLSG